ncbi:hypothetical protein EBAPG3_15030 [Nitrosospira lacus]|uniref:Uncharacterized protein n=1 Tax=Nitrosospira lacus TaxID=1288494 RepID=A0A1W6SP60_9PROT|nr:hypothetical protein EBAPG3_15030 [Nitrosospira lacus]
MHYLFVALWRHAKFIVLNQLCQLINRVLLKGYNFPLAFVVTYYSIWLICSGMKNAYIAWPDHSIKLKELSQIKRTETT